MADAAISPSPPVTTERLVTEDQVRAALTTDKGAAAQLTAWKVVDFTKKGDNYASVVTSVEVKYELDGKSSEVAYVFFPRYRTSDKLSIKEIGHTDINVPKCFHASLEEGKEVIFLEDLRARGYKMADRKQGLDKAHTTLVLRELARLHAASLLLQNRTPYGDIAEKYPLLKISLPYFIRNYDSLLNVYKESAKLSQTIIKKVDGYERVIAWIDTIIPNLRDIFSEQMEHVVPKVVCHGDCWNNNFLFKYSETGHPEDAMLLDFQLTSFNVPALDLNHFFYTSMTGDVRKPNIEAFLGFYYTTFKDVMEAGGKTVPFTHEQLLNDFRDGNLIGLAFAMMFVPLVLFETEDEVDTSKENEEDMSEMFQETREKALEMIDTNPLVKPRFLSVFDEMIELGIIP
ncbi:uncharacterized protein LOC123506650 [Portunus trituberculatus]|uniref:uncharacterized protein LOC123506650 n=1 Tax=Portunus trituberculatus TaxID=210409 RepID=UPI001E1D16F7|nr:uncharacterized protein LOC123506650 [Portunus trituberculatus]